MVGVYILMGFVIALQILQIVLVVVACNFLVRTIRKLDDITTGVSTVMDQTKPKRRTTTASGDPSGLIDLPQPVGTYDTRYDGPVQEQ